MDMGFDHAREFIRSPVLNVRLRLAATARRGVPSPRTPPRVRTDILSRNVRSRTLGVTAGASDDDTDRVGHSESPKRNRLYRFREHRVCRSSQAGLRVRSPAAARMVGLVSRAPWTARSRSALRADCTIGGIPPLPAEN